MTKRTYRTAAIGASLLATVAIAAPTAIGQSDSIPADHTIDVLVLYTGAAEESEGGEEEIHEAIDSGLEGMSKALDRSDIEGKVDLAHAEKIDFEETDDQGDAMTWARERDEVADLREEHEADLVSVVVSGTAGIAQSPIPDETTSDSAFSVVGSDWLRSDDETGEAGVFAHELGHNLGASHDWDTDPGRNEERPYNKGHITENGLVDIMAYNNASSCEPDCERVPYYSNPDIEVEGEKFGADDGDRPSNLKKLFDETIPVVAAYR
ncbi:MAG TPA: hypothetical protein H9870_07255 [Candidatus Corynebacterium avicola]|uniref:Uncharacterized protein n=1 Tax=Candidatus Corynebacterium avicola TaxID=2838527 RepID=A0A9D1UKN8_9CORY|nr:hypothetical protein [Candidatus Corynebacterium avicola]